MDPGDAYNVEVRKYQFEVLTKPRRKLRQGRGRWTWNDFHLPLTSQLSSPRPRGYSRSWFISIHRLPTTLNKDDAARPLRRKLGSTAGNEIPSKPSGNIDSDALHLDLCTDLGPNN
jgi:hypothetical protein